MLGRKVNHKVFGCGTITELTSAYLTVNFGDSEKKFVYPDAFEKYLTSTDPELMEQVDKDIQSKKICPLKFCSVCQSPICNTNTAADAVTEACQKSRTL